MTLLAGLPPQRSSAGPGAGILRIRHHARADARHALSAQAPCSSPDIVRFLRLRIADLETRPSGLPRTNPVVTEYLRPLAGEQQ